MNASSDSFPEIYLCVCVCGGRGGEGRDSFLLLGLPQVFSDLGRVTDLQTLTKSQKTYCPHWAEVCQGLRDENLVFGSVHVCETPSGCVCHTQGI